MKQLFRKRALLLYFAVFSTSVASAQVKIGSNPTTINSSSILEIESTNKGVLMPRIALTAADNASPLSNHVVGMIIYNTATAGTAPNIVTPGFYYNDGTRWQVLKSSKTASVLTISDGGAYTPLDLTSLNQQVNTVKPLAYTGSNGGIIEAQRVASTSVLGLTAIIQPQVLKEGDGTFYVQIIGVPESEGLASFAITIPGASMFNLRYRVAAASVVESTAWDANGNFNTDPTVNFLGTRDATPLIFKTNEEFRIKIDEIGRVGVGTGNGPITGTFVVKNVGTNRSFSVKDDVDNENFTVLNTGNVGIGTIAPLAQLHTTGTVRFAGAGTPGPGKILTSDADGNATWESGASGLAGADGKSAFEVWKAILGNEGKTITDYLASIKGDTGAAGTDGVGGLSNPGTGIQITGSGTVAAPYVISTNTAEITLLGDVTGKANATVIANDAVTTTKIANNAVTNAKIGEVISVANGGSGSNMSSTEGYVKQASLGASFTTLAKIPVADVDGAVKKVNGVVPDADGNVATILGRVFTGAELNPNLAASIIAASPAKKQSDIYIVADGSNPNNGRTFIYDGTNWLEVAIDLSTTDARYVNVSGDTMEGNLTVPTGKTIILTDAPTAATSAANKAYVDTKIATADNGLTATSGNVKLGGTLTAATSITTNATNTLAIAGLQDGANTDKMVVVDGSGVLKSVTATTRNINAITKVSAAYIVTATDYTILANASSGAFTLTLPDPAATSSLGRILVIRKTDETSNVLTFSRAIKISETRDFTTLNMNTTIRIQSDGTDWYKID
jgi:hypothetical protein